MKKWRYNNLFIYSSFQFSGNIEEYFSKNSKKLIAFIILPRIKNKENFIRVYEKGVLRKEIEVKLSQNIFLYYLLWYFNYIKCLFMFNKDEKIIVLGMHPITFFGMWFQKIIRNITFVYWICDYFPGNGIVIKLYEKLKKHYHDSIPYSIYLSDEINKVFNKRIINSKCKKTVMWGVKSKKSFKRLYKINTIKILFVGIIKEQQGLESLFNYLQKNNNSQLSILGVCEEWLYKKYKKIIKELKIEKQVYFPNKNFYKKELLEFASNSDIGIALYDTGKDNVTYYADPAKIKTYTEFGLPVIMSNISSIAKYIEKFKAGVVIDRDEKSIENAIEKIRRNYSVYQNGVRKFNDFFYYEKYYCDSLRFLEKI